MSFLLMRVTHQLISITHSLISFTLRVNEITRIVRNFVSSCSMTVDSKTAHFLNFYAYRVCARYARTLKILLSILSTVICIHPS